MTKPDKFVIGLTGGIASGKSAVADRFTSHGIAIVDTDQLAREVVEPGTAGLSELIEAFGPEVLDGSGRLDRRRLRDMVFSEETARERLNAIVHPRVRELAMQRLAQAASEYALLVVPLLVEGGLAGAVDRILVVDVPEQTQVRRVMARDDVSRQQARSILAAQASREQRLAAADDVIDNDTTLASLHAQVDALHQRYLAMATENTRRHSAFE